MKCSKYPTVDFELRGVSESCCRTGEEVLHADGGPAVVQLAGPAPDLGDGASARGPSSPNTNSCPRYRI